jgi:hypothetical protein
MVRLYIGLGCIQKFEPLIVSPDRGGETFEVFFD